MRLQHLHQHTIWITHTYTHTHTHTRSLPADIDQLMRWDCEVSSRLKNFNHHVSLRKIWKFDIWNKKWMMSIIILRSGKKTTWKIVLMCGNTLNWAVCAANNCYCTAINKLLEALDLVRSNKIDCPGGGGGPGGLQRHNACVCNVQCASNCTCGWAGGEGFIEAARGCCWPFGACCSPV